MWSFVATLLISSLFTQAGGDLYFGPAGSRIPSEREIGTAIGSDAESRTVIPEAIARFVGVVPLTNSINVLAAQLPPEWLPRIADVKFTRLDLPDAKREWDECSRLLWLTITTSENVLSVGVTEGNRCNRKGMTFEFERREGRWLTRQGIPAGTLSGVVHCGCM